MSQDAVQEFAAGSDESGRRICVLVVDDNEGDYVLVKSLLGHVPAVEYEVRWLASGDDISERIADIRPDICLIDYNLVAETGLELIKTITQLFPHLPSVLLTGDSDPDIDAAAMQAGAADFIEKSRFDARDLDRTIRYAVEQKRVEGDLAVRAETDELTGLYNRAGFSARLEQAMAVANRTERYLGVMFIDLDRFKHVNDSLGHAAGDALLQAVARRIHACCRATDVVARMGGDEFAVIATHMKEPSLSGLLADKIVSAFIEPFEIDGHVVHAGASVGVTTYPVDDGSAEQLLMNADMALYRAKEEGRNRYAMFDRDMETAARQRQETDAELRLAIERDELFLEYQPIIAAATGRVEAIEALVRWGHRDGVRYPDSFIEIAESSNLINLLGEWVLRDACRMAARRIASGAEPIRVTVNLSAAQLAAPDLVGVVQLVLAETGLPAELLELEITESVMIPNFEGGERVLTRLREIGVSISIDDFGTGYTALEVLRGLPVQKLKIDRSFIWEIDNSKQVPPVVKAIVEIGRAFSLDVIAEGIETDAQHECMRELGVDSLQGFHIARPARRASFETWLTQSEGGRAALAS
ncbi:MAG: EAL domain-containing protein [Alphaproteobacteria bacterium]